MAKKIIKKGKNKFTNKNHQNSKSQNKLKTGGADKGAQESTSNLIQESVKDHFFTFNLKIDLFTILYSTLVFKWIQTDRVLIVVDDNKLGYHIELFLKYFRMNSVYLDNEMPVNTNRHYMGQFVKGVYNICITSNKFKENASAFQKDIVEYTPIPATIIYFDCIDSELLQYHCFNANTKAIYHFISKEKEAEFSKKYESIDELITFQNYKFDEDQVSHLKYRCEDIFHSIHKSDIKKAKIKKINQELLYSKNMQDYFKSHPEEKSKVITAIEQNSIKGFKPSATYLPSYLIHKEDGAEGINNQFSNAIKKNYSNVKNKNIEQKSSNDRKKKGTMEKYLESLEKNDGSAETFKF